VGTLQESAEETEYSYQDNGSFERYYAGADGGAEGIGGVVSAY